MRRRKPEPSPIDPVAIYDEAVKRWLDHTTEQFREFHAYTISAIRRRVKAVTEELEHPYSS